MSKIEDITLNILNQLNDNISKELQLKLKEKYHQIEYSSSKLYTTSVSFGVFGYKSMHSLTSTKIAMNINFDLTYLNSCILYSTNTQISTQNATIEYSDNIISKLFYLIQALIDQGTKVFKYIQDIIDN